MTGSAGIDAEGLTDRVAVRRVRHRDQVFAGAVWDVVREQVDLGPAGVVHREYVQHPGAVAVLVLDETDRVLMVRQYRHPVRHELWELPAGLLDVDGESPLDAARRELAEEADRQAEQWHVLLDWFTSPGGMDEAIRVYLARGISLVPADQRHQRTGEELDMPVRWVDLDLAQQAVLRGDLHNPATVVGILTAHASRAQGWDTLRPGDAPWPQHPRRGAAAPV